ncbi:hypothetical protein [Alkalibacillus aidingensis]|uniref:hypothetical protein n=1 Tax=Alkalibacillus aidingensis TaxID=2747607 RepID=UPI0016600AD6|nr:hypothetical protein [Alkalibacillus aidingensis]
MMVNMIPINEVSELEYEQFFKDGQPGNQKPEEDWAHEYGYFIELEGEKIGFFVLYPVEGGAWLRRLLMKEQANPALIILVFDWISEHALKHGYQKLYTHVDDSSKRVLLEMNHFQESNAEPPVDAEISGDWFEKKLNSPDQVK